MPVFYRQNPDNPCLLEYSHDNLTWLSMFDYSLCLAPQIQQITYQVHVTQIYLQNDRRERMYDGTPGSVNPEAPGDKFNGDNSGARNDALCTAVYAYVLHKVLETYWLYLGMLTTSALATGFAGWTVLGLIVGGVVTVIAGLAFAKVNAAANDEQANKNVACSLLDALKGKDTTQAEFIAAINGLSGATENEQTIVQILKNGAGDIRNYLHFLDLLGQAYAGSVAGCPCNDCPDPCTELAHAIIDGAPAHAGCIWSRPDLFVYPSGYVQLNVGDWLEYQLGSSYCVMKVALPTADFAAGTQITVKIGDHAPFDVTLQNNHNGQANAGFVFGVSPPQQGDKIRITAKNGTVLNSDMRPYECVG